MKKFNAFSKPLLTISATMFVLAGCNQLPQQPETVEPTPTPVVIEENLTNDQIASAIENQEPLACDILSTSEQRSMQLYVDGLRMRLAGVDLGDQRADGTLVSDGSMVYIWENEQTTGLKSDLPSQEHFQSILDQAQQTGMNIPNFTDPATVEEFENRGYIFTCQRLDPSTVDFTAPTDVTFTDVTGLVNRAIENATQE